MPFRSHQCSSGPRRVCVDPLRFAAGWRAVLGAAEEADETGIRVDLIRSSDLLALSVHATGCELITGCAQPPHLRPIEGEDARLTVLYAFQHGHEQALYEGKAPGDSDVKVPRPDGKPIDDTAVPDGPAARPIPPIGFIPARSTRLVFAIPASDTIEFSTAGILAAMSRLELVVHPLAQPGDAPVRGSTGALSLGGLGPIIHLPAGLVAHLTANGAIISHATAALRTLEPEPDPSTIAGTVFRARELRRARAELQSRTATTAARTRLPDASIFGPGGLVPDSLLPPRLRRGLSRPPTTTETAIEAPFRLVISPSKEARWAHANLPVSAEDAPQHVELWHSRLAILKKQPDGSIVPDEQNKQHRIIRAIWARDRDTVGDAWKDTSRDADLNNPLSHVDLPFRGSLDRADRHMLVRQTAETWPGKRASIAPVPVGVDALWLSGLGAWLDLHGGWTTKPYSEVGMASILAWDHVAPLGRDQYVRVVYPGYLYPFGHQAALVKITMRKMKDVAPSLAGLYQRKFLVIGERARTYADTHDFPFTRVEIRPLVTPTLDDPGSAQNAFFWPVINGQRFRFTIDTLDHEGGRTDRQRASRSRRRSRCPRIWPCSPTRMARLPCRGSARCGGTRRCTSSVTPSTGWSTTGSGRRRGSASTSTPTCWRPIRPTRPTTAAAWLGLWCRCPCHRRRRRHPRWCTR
jgi:hypothetical protein